MKIKVKIKKNPNGDTRTAKKDVTFSEFQKANDMHRQDVQTVMYHLSNQMRMQGIKHDWTKISKEKLFYKDFLATMNEGADFVNAQWYQLHIHEEKHHPLSYCHDDVNLLDIIEMVVDCVCAGKARSGEVRELEISDEILKLALNNTVKLVDDMTFTQESK